MNIINKVTFFILSVVTATTVTWAYEAPHNYIASRMTPLTNSDYTVLDAAQYTQTVKKSRAKIHFLLKQLKTYPYQDNNARIAFIIQQLSNIPYIFIGATGEGDWQPTSSLYQPGAVHVKQDPVYRLDGLDCQTFVQVVMGLLYSKNLSAFDQNIIKISYGAAGNPSGEILHYFNRNNFIEGDWNPINQHNGWLTDVTSRYPLIQSAETISVNITRQNWFLFQQKNLAATIRVLTERNGPLMVNRYVTTYTVLDYPHFNSETLSIHYLPKEKIALRQSNGHYQPNQTLLNQIPTPAVIEIIRDTKKWNIGGKSIKDIIGTELSVSHMGLLYRQNFRHGDLIYRKITCHYGNGNQKLCQVTPITCQKNQCNELMFAHATDSHPYGYYWYRQSNGNYYCSSKLPSHHTSYTQCNRVEQLPLFNYLTDYQYGSYWYMNSPSILGIHVEKLS